MTNRRHDGDATRSTGEPQAVVLIASCLALIGSTGIAAQSRFAIDEALREGGTIWEWVALIAAGYALGLGLLFPAFLVKYRRQSSEPSYVFRCWKHAIEGSWQFAGVVLLAITFGTPLLLIPSGIVIAVVNIVAYSGRAEGLLNAWLVGTLGIVAVGSCVGAFIFQLRDSGDQLPLARPKLGA
jgi:hypothetical protein